MKNEFFEAYVEVPRIQIYKKQIIETLINEESFILSKFLRDEQEIWMPRILIF